MKPISKRLLFREIEESDVEILHDSFSDPETMKYWLGGLTSSIEETRQKVEEMKKHWLEYGHGDWIITSKDGEDILGYCGLHHVEEMEEVNISYVINKKFWGKGLASEAAIAAIQFGFEHLEFKQVVAVIHPENRGSAQVALNSGMNFWKEFTWKEQARLAYQIFPQSVK
ncbi:MAG: GNAT family N-acetyltransferase [Halobacteriovoraceae bacterium]|jgi:[ribosomal protein S5]-alanine N-acetyltransferase|nr:GNAT family N-acetyltransferase [Halobacteriovoraceae bacterium]MBT5095186.1 GNAT family N-acetyltransferase [Halobacteriovoraceae bacterium]